MADFRYAQFCPLARAAEILGERWTLLVVRELLLSPRRFRDLQRGLPGVSTSVLADRLARLEERGLVAQTTLPPPASATVYELTASGRALESAVIELARWGARFLDAPRAGDHFEPDWARLALRIFARRRGSPERSFAIHVPDGEREIAFSVAGGPRGTALLEGVPPEGPQRADASLHVDSPLTLLGLAAGHLDPDEAIAGGRLRAEGDRDALREFPALFETSSDDPEA